VNRALLRTELQRDEGLRFQAYQDTLGFWTIGYGHLLGSTPRMQLITHDEADALLEMDIDTAMALTGFLAPGLIASEDARARAVTNMAFNLGMKLAGFKKFLAAVHSDNWPVAAAEMMDSLWAKQVGVRAARLYDMMLKGDA